MKKTRTDSQSGNKKLTVGDRVFKDALLRGTGRCFAMLATESARRKFRPLLMWACGRNLGYDTQVEGTRAHFLYDLICRYPSPVPFLHVVEGSFLASFNKGNWLFQQECELLALFAKDGNVRARRILEQGYGRFSQYLRHLNPARLSRYVAIDNFESLCKQLMFCAKPAEAQSILERIVRDVGGLCMRDPFRNATADFVQHYLGIVLGDRRVVAMLGRIGHTPEVEAYKAAVLQAKKEAVANHAKWRRGRALGYKEVYRRVSEQDTSGIRYIVRRWRLGGRTKDINGLVKLYVAEKGSETRARLLDMFSVLDSKGCLPLDCVLRDASSGNDRLRVSALGVLEGVKNPRVRDFALDMLRRRGVSYEVLSVLAGNYRESDDDLLIAALKKFGGMQRHHLGSVVLDNVGGKGGRLSRRILICLYDTTRCSLCRERVVRDLGRRRLLTDDMLAECLHDASVDIRDYAKRLLSRRRTMSAYKWMNSESI